MMRQFFLIGIGRWPNLADGSAPEKPFYMQIREDGVVKTESLTEEQCVRLMRATKEQYPDICLVSTPMPSMA